MRKWILKIHLYGGLICFWYLILFAISSLHYHYHFDFMERDPSVVETNQVVIAVASVENNLAMAEALRDELDLVGWILPWTIARDSLGVFQVEVSNFKAQYVLEYNGALSQVTVTKKHKGFWKVFNTLHGFAGVMPNAPWMVIWEIFTYVCVIMICFSIGSGIWLWAKRSHDQLIGWMVVVGITSISILLMVVVYKGL